MKRALIPKPVKCWWKWIPKYFRPAEVEQLLGDPTKAKTLLGWNPRKTSFEELVKIMVTHDMAFVKKLYMRAQMDGENTSQTC